MISRRVKMTIFQRAYIVSLLLVLACADLAAAQTVYMNDKSEIEAQSAWKDGETVYVVVNRDLCLDFPVTEVDIRKSQISTVTKPRMPQPAKPVDQDTAEAVSTKSTDMVDELIQVAGHRRILNDTFGTNTHSYIDEILARSFSPELAERTLKKTLERRLNSRDLAAVLAWFKGRVGRKIVEADSVVDFNEEESRLTYVTTDSSPDIKERKNLIAQIEKLARASEAETKLTRGLMIKMMNAIPPDFPDSKEVKQRIKDELPRLETKRKENVARWAYSYRGISVSGLREYLKFLRSGPGKRYTDAVREADAKLFEKVAANMEKDFRKDLKKMM